MRAPLIGSVSLLASCGPLSTLDPAGPQSRSVFGFTVAMTLVGCLAFVLVIVLFALAVRRARRGQRQDGGDPDAYRALHAHRWTVWLGIAFPMTALTVLLVATLSIGERQFVRDDRLPTWRGTASQWGWTFARIQPDGTVGASIDRLVIPAGAPVIVEIVSTDVIHSFWVPRLAGKMDSVPGKTNRHLIEADKPGIYRGVCAEYCGIGHDRMRFEVVAVAQPDRAIGTTR